LKTWKNFKQRENLIIFALERHFGGIYDVLNESRSEARISDRKMFVLWDIFKVNPEVCVKTEKNLYNPRF
jgi:hypothetical protein